MKPLSLKRQFLFFSQLANLYKAGIPLAQGIGHLRDQLDDKKLLEVIDVLDEYITRRSQPLVAAMRAMPGVFPPLVLALVEQGEETGRLDHCFAKIVSLIEKRRQRAGEVQQAMAYPCFVAVSAILMLPIPGAYAGGLSVYLSGVLPPILGIAAVIFGIVKIRGTMRNSAGLRYRVHKALLGFPMVGKLLNRLVLSRFASALSLMLASGLPADKAISVSARSTENDYVVLSVGPVLDSIREGNSLSDSLAKSTVFPASFSKMVAVGETTGEITAQLDRLASLYESEADAAIGVFLKSLGPLLLIVVGALVAVQILGFYSQRFDELQSIR